MRKLVIVLSVVAASAANAQEAPPRLVEVQGEGVVKVQPDQVSIRVGVEHEGQDAAVVKQKADAVIAQVLELLKKEGVGREDVQTNFVRLDKSYDYNTKTYKYRASQRLSIELDDLENYDRVMNGLVSSGINRIDAISFGTSELKAIEVDARKRAMMDARQKAVEYAAAVDQEIGKAHYIRENREQGPSPVLRSAVMMDQGSGNGGNTLAPGEIEVRAVVYVGFILY